MAEWSEFRKEKLNNMKEIAEEMRGEMGEEREEKPAEEVDEEVKRIEERIEEEEEEEEEEIERLEGGGGGKEELPPTQLEVVEDFKRLKDEWKFIKSPIAKWKREIYQDLKGLEGDYEKLARKYKKFKDRNPMSFGTEFFSKREGGENETYAILKKFTEIFGAIYRGYFEGYDIGRWERIKNGGAFKMNLVPDRLRNHQTNLLYRTEWFLIWLGKLQRKVKGLEIVRKKDLLNKFQKWRRKLMEEMRTLMKIYMGGEIQGRAVRGLYGAWKFPDEWVGKDDLGYAQKRGRGLTIIGKKGTDWAIRLRKKWKKAVEGGKEISHFKREIGSFLAFSKFFKNQMKEATEEEVEETSREAEETEEEVEEIVVGGVHDKLDRIANSIIRVLKGEGPEHLTKKLNDWATDEKVKRMFRAIMREEVELGGEEKKLREAVQHVLGMIMFVIDPASTEARELLKGKNKEHEKRWEGFLNIYSRFVAEHRTDVENWESLKRGLETLPERKDEVDTRSYMIPLASGERGASPKWRKWMEASVRFLKSVVGVE